MENKDVRIEMGDGRTERQKLKVESSGQWTMINGK